MWILYIRMFFITFLQEGWKVPKASCPLGTMHHIQRQTPAQEAFRLSLKDIRTFCISFSFVSITDASFATFTLALIDQRIVCLGHACCFPQGLSLLQCHEPSCLLSNKKCCMRPIHGEAERSAISLKAPPGIQDQNQDLKNAANAFVVVLMLFCLYTASCSGQLLNGEKNAPRNLVFTLI